MLVLYRNSDICPHLDFRVEVRETSENGTRFLSGFIKREYDFKDNKGNFIGYIRVHICHDRDGNIQAPIIRDITSGSGFSHFSDEMKQFYLDKGFNTQNKKKGFGSHFLEYVLKDIRVLYPEQKIILVNSYTQNESHVARIISEIQDRVDDLISSVSGGNDIHAFTIFM